MPSSFTLCLDIVLTVCSVEHVIYEKNPDIGGTWFENRYPGCACDVPSHAYTYNFALKYVSSSRFDISTDSLAL